MPIKPGSKYDHLVRGISKLKPGEAFWAERGGTFSCQPASFQNILYQVASTAGKDWRVATLVRGPYVVWAFYKRTDYMKPNLPAYPVVKKMRG